MLIFFLADLSEHELTNKVHRHLLENGISVWQDSTTSDEPIETRLKRWFTESNLIVVFATPPYLSSNWFQTCWKVAIQVSTTKLVVLLDGAAFEERAPEVSIIAATERDDVPRLVVDYVLRSSRDRIFISYSRRNRTLADLVTRLLSSSLSEHWIDTSSLVEGKGFPEQIKHAIRECDVFLLLWSIHAARSEWVAKEWNYAIEQRKLIIPILLGKAPLPVALADIHSFKSPFDPHFFERFNIPERQPSVLERMRLFWAGHTS